MSQHDLKFDIERKLPLYIIYLDNDNKNSNTDSSLHENSLTRSHQTTVNLIFNFLFFFLKINLILEF